MLAQFHAALGQPLGDQRHGFVRNLVIGQSRADAEPAEKPLGL